MERGDEIVGRRREAVHADERLIAGNGDPD
jgi:hypothetical protein